jgi:hypothetical protein
MSPFILKSPNRPVQVLESLLRCDADVVQALLPKLQQRLSIDARCYEDLPVVAETAVAEPILDIFEAPASNLAVCDVHAAVWLHCGPAWPEAEQAS